MEEKTLEELKAENAKLRLMVENQMNAEVQRAPHPVTFWSPSSAHKVLLRRSHVGLNPNGQAIWIKPKLRQVAEFQPHPGEPGSRYVTDDLEEIARLRDEANVSHYVVEVEQYPVATPTARRRQQVPA